MGRHLRVAISGHGFGHATQTGVVIRALRARLPDLRVSVQSALPAEFLGRVLGGAIELVPGAPDVGMPMRTALEVDLDAGRAAYAAFHEGWDAKVTHAAAGLAAAAPDLVLANAPYLPIAAAAAAGIPALAYCSHNWAAVYATYFSDLPEGPRIHEEIRRAYALADAFLVCAPGVPMADLPNVRRIGPCAALGRERRAELRRALGLSRDERVVQVAMGGIALATNCYQHWPVTAGTHWVIQAEALPPRPDMTRLADVGLPPIDFLCSCDALVTKLGYSFPVECGCNGIPLLYIPRPEWPETPPMTAWVEQHLRAAPLDLPTFEAGTFVGAMQALWDQPAPPRMTPSGVEEAVEILLGYLG